MQAPEGATHTLDNAFLRKTGETWSQWSAADGSWSETTQGYDWLDLHAKPLCVAEGIPAGATHKSDDVFMRKVGKTWSVWAAAVGAWPPLQSVATYRAIRRAVPIVAPALPAIQAPAILQQGVTEMSARAAERDQPNGERTMARCVAAFNVMFDRQLTEEQGWQFMELLKMARASGGGFKLDDYVDGAAYAALAGEAASRERNNGK